MSLPEQAAKRAAELREAIALHNYQYHVLDSPEIPDSEYIEKMMADKTPAAG